MKKLGLVFVNNSCDSTLVIGDLILINMPKDTEASRTKYYRDLSKNSVTQQEKDFSESAAGRGIGGVTREKVYA
jgi:hypothetical protein